MKKDLKKIIYDNKSLIKSTLIINKLVDILEPTKSKEQQTVIIKKKDKHIVTNDSLIISENFPESNNDLENITLKIIKKYALKTLNKTGSGFYENLILIKEILNNFTDLIINKNHDRLIMKQKFDKIINKIISKINKNTKFHNEIIFKKFIDDNLFLSSEIKNILNNGYSKSNFIPEFIINKSLQNKNELNVINLIKYNVKNFGYSRKENQKNYILKKPLVLLFDKKVNLNDISKYLSMALKKNRSILIIAEEFNESEIISTMEVNNLRLNLNSLIVTNPAFGDRRNDILKDIAIGTNSKIIDDRGASEYYVSSKNPSYEHFGNADFVKIEHDLEDNEKNKFLISFQSSEKFTNRIKSIRQMITETNSNFDKEKFEERLVNDSMGGLSLKLLNENFDKNKKEIEKIIKIIENYNNKGYVNLNSVINSEDDKIIYDALSLLFSKNENISSSLLINLLKNSLSVIKIILNTSVVILND